MVGRNPLTVLNEETKREKEMRRGRRRQHHKAVSAPAATYIHIYTQRERERERERESRKHIERGASSRLERVQFRCCRTRLGITTSELVAGSAILPFQRFVFFFGCRRTTTTASYQFSPVFYQQSLCLLHHLR